MKVLFLMNHIIMGGLEKVLLQYIDYLNASGEQVTVLSRETVSDKYFLDFFKSHNINLVILNNHKPHFFLNKIFAKCLAAIRLHKNISKNDVIVDFANFSFIKELKKVAKQKIGYCHGSILFFDSMIDKSVLDIYDNIVCLSDSFKQDFIKLYPQYSNKIHRIYNPINVQSVRNLTNKDVSIKRPCFVAVQRLNSADKDVATIIKAFNIFSEHYPRYSLYVIGDGPQRSELENLAKDNKQIIFTGQINNPYPYIRRSRALILSSTNTIGEGLPNTLLEAQSLGVLAISSDVPSGPKEILLNGQAGLLFTAGNHNELANILIDIANKKYNVDKILKQATKNLDRFNLENNVNKLSNLIRRNV